MHGMLRRGSGAEGPQVGLGMVVTGNKGTWYIYVNLPLVTNRHITITPALVASSSKQKRFISLDPLNAPAMEGAPHRHRLTVTRMSLEQHVQ